MRKIRVPLWVRKIPWRGKRQPIAVFWPVKSHEQRSLVGYSPWDRKESDTTERLTLAHWKTGEMLTLIGKTERINQRRIFVSETYLEMLRYKDKTRILIKILTEDRGGSRLPKAMNDSSCCAVSSSVTPWAVTCQVPLSIGFPRQEYCSGLPFPPPGGLPNPGIQPRSPTLQEDPAIWATRVFMHAIPKGKRGEQG